MECLDNQECQGNQEPVQPGVQEELVALQVLEEQVVPEEQLDNQAQQELEGLVVPVSVQTLMLDSVEWTQL